MRIKPKFNRGDSLKPLHDDIDEFRRDKLQLLIETCAVDREHAHDMQKILFGIAWAVDVQLNALQFADEKAHESERLELMAWRTRNLMEHLIFARFVTKSRANAELFAKDWVLDGIGIFEALRDWLKTTGMILKPDQHPNPQIRQLYQWKGEFKLSKGFIRTRDLAKAQNFQDEYDTLNKLYSKLVHPTSWSILRIHDKVDPEGMGYFLFFRGVRYAMLAYDALEAHYSVKGFNFP